MVSYLSARYLSYMVRGSRRLASVGRPQISLLLWLDVGNDISRQRAWVAHLDPGAECPTGPLAVQVRNLAAALLLAHGVPMFAMGDEYGHSKVRPGWRACTVLSGRAAPQDWCCCSLSQAQIQSGATLSR